MPVLFTTFRLMVAIGFLFLFLMVWALVLWRRGRIFEARPSSGPSSSSSPSAGSRSSWAGLPPRWAASRGWSTA